MSSENYLI